MPLFFFFFFSLLFPRARSGSSLAQIADAATPAPCAASEGLLSMRLTAVVVVLETAGGRVGLGEEKLLSRRKEKKMSLDCAGGVVLCFGCAVKVSRAQCPMENGKLGGWCVCGAIGWCGHRIPGRWDARWGISAGGIFHCYFFLRSLAFLAEFHLFGPAVCAPISCAMIRDRARSEQRGRRGRHSHALPVESRWPHWFGSTDTPMLLWAGPTSKVWPEG